MQTKIKGLIASLLLLGGAFWAPASASSVFLPELLVGGTESLSSFFINPGDHYEFLVNVPSGSSYVKFSSDVATPYMVDVSTYPGSSFVAAFKLTPTATVQFGTGVWDVLVTLPSAPDPQMFFDIFPILPLDSGPLFGPIGATPTPAALPLFATGLAGLGWLVARRRRKQAA